MKMRSLVVANLAFLATAWRADATSSTLEVTAGLYPTVSNAQVPTISVQPQNLTVQSVGSGAWNYSLPSGALFGRTIVTLVGIPAAYTSIPVSVALPFYADSPIQLDLYGVDVENTPSDVRQIYGTNLNELGLSELFEIYEEADVMSRQRLAAIESGERGLYVRDVQIFFKFLEATRDLGSDADIEADQSAQDVMNYIELRLDSESGGAIIEKAIKGGTAVMKQLLSQVRAVKAEHIKRAFNSIKGSWSSASAVESCLRFKELQSYWLDDVDLLQRQMWDQDPDYRFTQLITDAITRCDTVKIEKSVSNSGTVAPAVRDEVGEAYKAVERKAGGETIQSVAAALNKQRAVLLKFGIVK